MICRAFGGRSANSRIEFTEKQPFSPQLPYPSRDSVVGTNLGQSPAHQAGVRERHAHADFACGQTLADFCKVCTIKVSHSRGSLQKIVAPIKMLYTEPRGLLPGTPS